MVYLGDGFRNKNNIKKELEVNYEQLKRRTMDNNLRSYFTLLFGWAFLFVGMALRNEERMVGKWKKGGKTERYFEIDETSVESYFYWVVYRADVQEKR